MNIKPLQFILKTNDKKREQFLKVMDITFHLTSDYGCTIKMECYHGNIVRYEIIGTRSKFSVCFNSINLDILRKPRNEKPWFTLEKNLYMDEIIK